MESFIVKGNSKLKGKISVSGAKNSALPILAACILSNYEIIIHNLPRLQDILTMIEVLKDLGVKIKFIDDHTVSVDASTCNNHKASYEFVKKMRASFVVMGPLISRFGKAEVSYPGGCAIGARPVDIHLKGFEDLGIDIKVEHGYVSARTKKMNYGDIVLGFPSVGATENIIMCACIGNGTTKIYNAAKEVEIVELCKFLNKLGAKIKGAGNDLIIIEAVKKLGGCDYTITPDRIEAGTYLLAGAATNSDIVVENIIATQLDSLIVKLKTIGADLKINNNNIRIKGSDKLKSLNVTSEVYPGFPTDLLPQFMAVMTIAKGTSFIKETIFENRFMHVAEMLRMGAKIQIIDRTASVEGVEKLTGAEVMASDIRAGAALIICSLIAEGETKISRIYHIDRGYEKIEEKLIGINVNIKRI